MVDLDSATLAFDLRGQQVIRNFGVRELDGDAATAVTGEDRTAAVDGRVVGSSRVAMLVRPEGMPKISTMGSTV